MIRSSMLISAFTLVSRAMGFVRDLAITYFMGASATIAADVPSDGVVLYRISRG